MKKFFTILIAALMSVSMSATVVEHVQIGDLYYNLDTDSRTAAVTWEKLIRNGNVYILTETKTYTITGTEVR